MSSLFPTVIICAFYLTSAKLLNPDTEEADEHSLDGFVLRSAAYGIVTYYVGVQDLNLWGGSWRVSVGPRNSNFTIFGWDEGNLTIKAFSEYFYRCTKETWTNWLNCNKTWRQDEQTRIVASFSSEASFSDHMFESFILFHCSRWKRQHSTLWPVIIT